MLGPGLTTGASDDDPSGIATYRQTGAQYGFNFLWLALADISADGRHPGNVCPHRPGDGQGTGRQHPGPFFSKKILYICTLLLFTANTFNIGANLGAMAKAMQLLNPRLEFRGCWWSALPS